MLLENHFPVCMPTELSTAALELRGRGRKVNNSSPKIVYDLGGYSMARDDFERVVEVDTCGDRHQCCLFPKLVGTESQRSGQPWTFGLPRESRHHLVRS